MTITWELSAPDGMVLEPTTTYALVFLGDGGTYPKSYGPRTPMARMRRR